MGYERVESKWETTKIISCLSLFTTAGTEKSSAFIHHHNNEHICRSTNTCKAERDFITHGEGVIPPVIVVQLLKQVNETIAKSLDFECASFAQSRT